MDDELEWSSFNEYVDFEKYDIIKKIKGNIPEDNQGPLPELHQNPTRKKKWWKYTTRDLPKSTFITKKEGMELTTYERALNDLINYAKNDIPKQLGNSSIFIVTVTGNCEEDEGEFTKLARRFDTNLTYNTGEELDKKSPSKKPERYTSFILHLKTYVWEKK